MAFFGLLGGKPKGYASPWLQLTVVHAYSHEGLSADEAFSLRGRVIQSKPIDFEFKPPHAYIAFFPATAAGLEQGTELAGALRNVAREMSLPAFGVGVLQGECLAQKSASGRFVAKPAGTVISLALTAAMEESGAKTQSKQKLPGQ